MLWGFLFCVIEHELWVQGNSGPWPSSTCVSLSVILMLLRIIVITTSIGKIIIISLSAEAPLPDPLPFPPSLIICSWAHCLPLSLFIFPPDPSLRLSTPLLSAPTPLSLTLKTPFIYLSLHLPTSPSTPPPTSVPLSFFSILIFGKLLGSFCATVELFHHPPPPPNDIVFTSINGVLVKF